MSTEELIAITEIAEAFNCQEVIYLYQPNNGYPGNVRTTVIPLTEKPQPAPPTPQT